LDPIVPADLDKYAEEHTERVDPLLDELWDETHRTMAQAQMQVGRLAGTVLKLLVQISGAKRALEVGMFTGYSGLMIASGLPDDGTLTTCDVDPKAEAVARRYFARSPHGRKITIRMGPALETIRTLSPPLDFVFIDADKQNYSNYYEAVLPLMPPGALLVADNTLWSGKVLHPKEKDDLAIVAFNDRVAKDDRVEKALLTVRDGMMVARKR
jgi:caffeoyl-CoA O-methyltransferase